MDVRNRQTPSNLRVAADISIAQLWLMPLLAEFARAYTQITASVVASDYEAECLVDSIDVALLYGAGQWAGLNAAFLLDEEVFAIAAPAYLQQHMLLDLRGRWDWIGWGQWLQAHERTLDATTPRREFNNLPVLVEAVISGQGIGLGWKHLLDAQLAKGLVTPVLPQTLRGGRGYFLVTGMGVTPQASRFCNWLAGRAGNSAAG